MPSSSVSSDSKLLDYLFASFPNFKKTKVKNLLKFGSVMVNHKIVTAHNHPLRRGDKIEILTKELARAESFKTRLSFPIVYEDEHLIVIDKPAGLLSMGTDKDKIRTAYFELNEYIKTKDSRGRGKIWIVHRLDRETSGLLLFAKSLKIQSIFQENWSDVVKKYYAVVEGVPSKKEGVTKSYLAEDKFKRVFSTNERSRDAKHAVTGYKVVHHDKYFSILEITLITGRKNQIRVHLSDLGHPVIGDQKYDSQQNPAGRLGLHAFLLSFKHPVTGAVKTLKSQLPRELEKVFGE